MEQVATQLINRTAELVSLPDIYLRVKSVIDDPESAVADLSAVLECDPSLTARMLKLANSPFFGLVSRVDTVQRATNLLGENQIHNLVLATAVADAFADTDPRNFNLHEFWVSAIHCGLLAKHLATACGLRDADRFFVSGLLHNIGHLIIDQGEPDKLSQALEQHASTGTRLHALETEIIGTDYAEIGALLMQGWSFPKPLVAAVRFQNLPDQAGDCLLDAALVSCASSLLEQHGETDEPPAIDSFVLETLGLDAGQLPSIAQSAAEDLNECVEALFPQAGSDSQSTRKTA